MFGENKAFCVFPPYTRISMEPAKIWNLHPKYDLKSIIAGTEELRYDFNRSKHVVLLQVPKDGEKMKFIFQKEGENEQTFEMMYVDQKGRFIIFLKIRYFF